MEKVRHAGRTIPATREIMWMGGKKDTACTCGPREIDMKGSGSPTRFKALAGMSGRMADATKDIGRKI
jgi:hypothetical protein